jgi:hypothetical protein
MERTMMTILEVMMTTTTLEVTMTTTTTLEVTMVIQSLTLISKLKTTKKMPERSSRSPWLSPQQCKTKE